MTHCRYVLEEKVLEIEIEPGMKDGYNYPFIAEGKICRAHSQIPLQTLLKKTTSVSVIR